MAEHIDCGQMIATSSMCRAGVSNMPKTSVLCVIPLNSWSDDHASLNSPKAGGGDR
jgi:hypothetical protein